MSKLIHFISRIAGACLTILILISHASGQDAPGNTGEQQYLLGDWAGKRTQLEEQGITFDAYVISDLVANVRGGLKRGLPYWNHLALGAALDTEKAGLWEDGTFLVLLNGDFGDEPTNYVGDFQWTDGWQGFNTVSVAEASYEHSAWNDSLALKAGLQDVSTEMNVLRYGFELLNSSFATNAEFSQIVPPIYPLSALGIRLKALPSETSYVLAGAFDGIPGRPGDYQGTHIELNKDDGLFSFLEGGFDAGEEADFSNYYKAALGIWNSSAHYNDFSGRARNHNSGFYLIAEKALMAEDDPSQGLGVFVQAGLADSDRNQVDQYYGLGFIYTGIITGRDRDSLWLAINTAKNGDDYVQAEVGRLRAESVLEVSYQAVVTPYFSLQPDLQLVINPGMNQKIDNALVLSLRIIVDL